jgi:predicted transcriptional regulator
MSSPGRPKIGEMVHFRLPDEIRRQVAALAADEGVSQSEWMRQAIAAQVARALTT